MAMSYPLTVTVTHPKIKAPTHRCLLECLNERTTASGPFINKHPPVSCSLSLSTSCRRSQHKGKAAEAKNNTSGRVGFGKEKKEISWQCAQGCGACCKLDKGPAFATPEEIFNDPAHVQMYRSMIGPDGWCIHFEKTTRTCSIYPDRPYFCRVEPKVFQELYGINEKRFNKEACSFCRDTIKEIYGPGSKELDNFNRTIRNSSAA